jgi:hypothetical protein
MITRCGHWLVGSGPDSWDPVCELPAGHGGRHRSSAAIDQHRLPHPLTNNQIEAVRWLRRARGGVVDRHTLFDYYDRSPAPFVMGMAVVARRGAAGQMASILHSRGLASDGKLSELGEQVGRAADRQAVEADG